MGPVQFILKFEDCDSAVQFAQSIHKLREARLKNPSSQIPIAVAVGVRVQVSWEDFLPPELLNLKKNSISGGSEVVSIFANVWAIGSIFLEAYQGLKFKIEPLSPPKSSKQAKETTSKPKTSDWNFKSKTLLDVHDRLISRLEGLNKISPSVDALIPVPAKTPIAAKSSQIELMLVTTREEKQLPTRGYFLEANSTPICPCLKIEIVAEKSDQYSDNFNLQPGWLYSDSYTWPVKITTKQTAHQNWAIKAWKLCCLELENVKPPQSIKPKKGSFKFQQSKGHPTMTLDKVLVRKLTMLLFADYWDRSGSSPADMNVDIERLGLHGKKNETIASVYSDISRLEIKCNGVPIHHKPKD